MKKILSAAFAFLLFSSALQANSSMESMPAYSGSKCKVPCVGPTGPTGATGPTGPIGPTGNFSGAYGSFDQQFPITQQILTGQAAGDFVPVEFNGIQRTVEVEPVGASPWTTFRFPVPGDYLVVWTFDVDTRFEEGTLQMAYRLFNVTTNSAYQPSLGFFNVPEGSVVKVTGNSIITVGANNEVQLQVSPNIDVRLRANVISFVRLGI